MYRLTMAVAIIGLWRWGGGGHIIVLEHVQTDRGSSNHWPVEVGGGGVHIIVLEHVQTDRGSSNHCPMWEFRVDGGEGI